MVKLTEPFDQVRRAVGERGSARTTPRWPRTHHNWGTRYGRRKAIYCEPKGLLELEELARRTVQLMEKHAPKLEKNYELAMDLLRQQYNMNFLIICEKCHGPHDIDENVAPER